MVEYLLGCRGSRLGDSILLGFGGGVGGGLLDLVELGDGAQLHQHARRLGRIREPREQRERLELR